MFELFIQGGSFSFNWNGFFDLKLETSESIIKDGKTSPRTQILPWNSGSVINMGIDLFTDTAAILN